ncbi:AAA family ATPase [Pseudomonas sp. PDM13]|uniref:AAA family ATPase n=1 Tax=Pseudomonas sp. PDM13 TaxID=2769255 RepID=UPI0021E043DD|nr:AAA family ATPase [Pseudomonas sp. PDM13]MCU9949914.1 AAA family ATPase [Pseudomonas sp. PDM13]
MSATFRTGLVVGKFSPLHLGHEQVIRTALGQCQRLLLLCWSLPELPGCDAERRERWLRLRFPGVQAEVVTPAHIQAWREQGKCLPDLPHNDAPEFEPRQFVAEFCQAVFGTTVDAVFTSESYGDGFAEHLAGVFGHPVRHVCVDQQRLAVPVSGTRLRADPHGLRGFLAPEVHADFVERIVFLGGESTGKSSLAIALAEALDAPCVAEFGREHWVAKDGALEYDDLLHIGRTQMAREDQAALEAGRYLVCDTSALTTLFYSHAMFGRAEAELATLAERPYTHSFLCADDFPFVQDGTRQDETFRRRQQAWYHAELQRRGWPYQVLTGSLDARVQQVLAHLRDASPG